MPMSHLKIALYEGQTKYDWTVRFRTFSSITHASLIYNNEKIEAMPFIGVRKVSWNDFPKPYKIHIFNIKNIDDVKSKKVWNWLLTQDGKGYDYWGVFGYTIVIGRMQERNKWFCSELVEEALRKVDIYLTPGFAPCKVSPGRLYESELLDRDSVEIIEFK